MPFKLKTCTAKSVHLAAHCPADLVARIDVQCKKGGVTRSEFLRQVVEYYIGELEKGEKK